MDFEREKEAEILAYEIYESLIDSCEVLRKGLPVSMRKVKGLGDAMFWGDDVVEYKRLLVEFNEGLDRIERLVEDGTAWEVFNELNSFYDTFCMMKRVHWESDTKFTRKLAKAIHDFGNASSRVIGFLRGKRKFFLTGGGNSCIINP